jgi:hypothetical protein
MSGARPLTTWERLKIVFAVAQIGFFALQIYRLSSRRDT